MKVVGLSGSVVGSKTRTAMNYTIESMKEHHPHTEVTILDLADYSVPYSDGRNYLDYEGDAKYITKTIMEADAIVIGAPIFQASMPAPLKNILDLLPSDAFQDKIVSMLITAGSSRHYLVAEQQLKPILAYMKAQIVQTYVYIEEKDFHQEEIINEEILSRIDCLVEDTVVLTKTYMKIRAAQEKTYSF